jgi:hypothetical protein
VTLDEQFDRIEVGLNTLKWMVGTNIVLTLLTFGIVVRLFVIS